MTLIMVWKTTKPTFFTFISLISLIPLSTVLDPSLPHWHETPLPWRLLDVHPSKEIRLGMDVVIKTLARVPVMFELITTAIKALSITCNQIKLFHTIY